MTYNQYTIQVQAGNRSLYVLENRTIAAAHDLLICNSRVSNHTITRMYAQTMVVGRREVASTQYRFLDQDKPLTEI